MATNSSTKPMVMTDTLAVDTLLIARWRDNPEFDYDAEFRGSGFSLWDWIERRIADLVDRLFGNTMLGDWSNVVWYVLGFSAIVAIVLFVFYRHPELLHVLRRGVKAKEEYEVVEDTIYGIDFRPVHAVEELSGVGAESFNVASLSFCIKRVKDKR